MCSTCRCGRAWPCCAAGTRSRCVPRPGGSAGPPPTGARSSSATTSRSSTCTPGHLHAEIAEAALAAGKHVLVEKPLANTVAESEALVVAAEAAAGRGVLSMVGFNYRRVPALALARELIAAGRLGEVREVRAAYLQDWLVDASVPMAWRLRREEAGSGALGDLGSHVVDQVQFLLGDTA